MESDFAKEMIRKNFHVLGLIYPILYYFYSQTILLVISSTIFIGFLLYESSRIFWKKELSFFKKYYRPDEKNKFGAQIHFSLGALLTIAFFDKHIAIAALLVMIFGDMAAALIGTKYGKHWIPGLKRKSWEGTSAELLVNLIVVWLVTFNPLLTITMALTGTLVETILVVVDDNLTIPLLTGLVGQIVKSIAV